MGACNAEPIAKLNFSFSKTEVKIGETIEVQLSLKNVGMKPLPEGDYILDFSREEEGPEGQVGYVIERVEIKGPIESKESIERKITLPVEKGMESKAYLFRLSFEKIMSRKPWRSRIIKTVEKEIILTVIPEEGTLEKEPEIPKIEEGLLLKDIEELALSSEDLPPGARLSRENYLNLPDLEVYFELPEPKALELGFKDGYENSFVLDGHPADGGIMIHSVDSLVLRFLDTKGAEELFNFIYEKVLSLSRQNEPDFIGWESVNIGEQGIVMLTTYGQEPKSHDTTLYFRKTNIVMGIALRGFEEHQRELALEYASIIENK